MRNHIFSGILLILIASCSTRPVHQERELKKSEIPEFLKKYDSKTYDDVEFYEKVDGDKKHYEVEYEENDKEVSLTFDETGTLIEKEKDISFKNISAPVKEKILAYLHQKYSGFVILEAEMREDEKGVSFIDVEIRHPSSKSGYWELSFTPQGEYVLREQEDHDLINTLN